MHQRGGEGRSLIDIYTTARLAVFTTDNYYCMHRSHRAASRRIHETLGIVIHDAVDAARKKLGVISGDRVCERVNSRDSEDRTPACYTVAPRVVGGVA